MQALELERQQLDRQALGLRRLLRHRLGSGRKVRPHGGQLGMMHAELAVRTLVLVGGLECVISQTCCMALRVSPCGARRRCTHLALLALLRLAALQALLALDGSLPALILLQALGALVVARRIAQITAEQRRLVLLRRLDARLLRRAAASARLRRRSSLDARGAGAGSRRAKV